MCGSSTPGGLQGLATLRRFREVRQLSSKLTRLGQERQAIIIAVGSSCIGPAVTVRVTAMRSRVSRHLDPVLLDSDVMFAARGQPLGAPPAEFNWRDYTAILLHVAAEIEHSLMVQYLFAAYSLGGPQVPSELRDEVRAWKETILGVAKEEMGHLMTVQNLHTALGLPLNLDREDYPWGSEFYPFDFTLQRLTLDSLATYVCAESPADWSGPEADEIRARGQRGRWSRQPRRPAVRRDQAHPRGPLAHPRRHAARQL